MDAKVLDILENCFEWNRDRKLIRKIRKEVEDFERWTEMKAAEMLRAKRHAKINLIYIILCNIQS